VLVRFLAKRVPFGVLVELQADRDGKARIRQTYFSNALRERNQEEIPGNWIPCGSNGLKDASKLEHDVRIEPLTQIHDVRRSVSGGIGDSVQQSLRCAAQMTFRNRGGLHARNHSGKRIRVDTGRGASRQLRRQQDSARTAEWVEYQITGSGKNAIGEKKTVCASTALQGTGAANV